MAGSRITRFLPMEIYISHRSRPRHDATFLGLELYSSTLRTTPNDCARVYGNPRSGSLNSFSPRRGSWLGFC